MKKKILVYSLGLVVCFAAIGSIAVNHTEKESVTVVTEEKKVPVCNAADTIDAGALSEEISLTENIDDVEEVEKTTEYLAYYFDISLENDGFIGGLKKICPEYKYTEETLSGAEMVKASIAAVGKEALAQTYSEEKIEERFEFYGIYEKNKKKSDIDSELKSYIVCALDLGMIDEEMAQSAINGEVNEEQQEELLMSVANMCGKGRNYIGYSNDENIYADLRFLYGLYPAFTEEELCEIATIALEDKNVQECVLKKAEYDARFLPALTISYSHESIEHMEQLIGLLNSENIVAKVQLEPKMIITKEDIKKAEKAKEETNDKKENSDKKIVENIGTLKYDLVFEFEAQEDMTRFGEVVEKYAKVQEALEENKEASDETETANEKTTDNEKASENETVPVIADSEKEAVYMAEESESMLSDENAREIEKIIVENDNGKLEFYCLLENTEDIKEEVLELAKEQELSIGEVKEEPETEEAETEKIKTEKENSQTEKKEEPEKKSQKKNTEIETKEKQTNTTKSEEAKEEQTTEEKATEKEASETNEAEEILEYSLKLYSKKYTCNKEFFFKLGGVDKEETEEQTTEQNTTDKK